MDIIIEIIAQLRSLKKEAFVMVAVINCLFCCLGHSDHMGIVLNGGTTYINDVGTPEKGFHHKRENP
jgi:hypothetical protein